MIRRRSGTGSRPAAWAGHSASFRPGRSNTYLLADGSEAAHFDFYRFSDPREWLDAGFREVFEQPGLKLAEWPVHAAGLLPAPDLRLLIEPDDTLRRVTVQAHTALGQALLA